MLRLLPARTSGPLAALVLLVACGDPKVVGGGPGAAANAPGAGAAGADAGNGPGISLPPAPSAPAADAGPPPAAPETCAADVRQAMRLPVDLLFVLDKSESMNLPIGDGTQWDLVREALLKFVAAPESAGLGIGLQLFPLVPPALTPCAQDAECTPNVCPEVRPRCSATGRACATPGQPCGGNASDLCTAVTRICASRGFPQCQANYTDPVVPVAPLPVGRPPFATRLLHTEPAGTTPLGPAVRGGLAHLRQRLQADSSRQAALVLATDGVPVGCPEQLPEIAAMIAAARQQTPPITSFVIGVFSSASSAGGAGAQAAFDPLARAGGSGEAIILEPNADLSARFLAALEKIRGAVLPCAFEIPAPTAGAIDFGRVNLRWKSPAATEEVLYVERPERCDPTRGGWYYDSPPAQAPPTRVLVCPATCDRFSQESSATVELTFGCRTRTID
jgi:hypothetical protein